MVGEREGASSVKLREEGRTVEEFQDACECVYAADLGGGVHLGILAEVGDEGEEERGHEGGAYGSGINEVW